MIKISQQKKAMYSISSLVILLPGLYVSSGAINYFDKEYNLGPDIQYYYSFLTFIIGFIMLSYTFLKPDNHEILEINKSNNEHLDGNTNSLSKNSIKNIFKREISSLEQTLQEELEKKYYKNSFNLIIDRLKNEIKEIKKRSIYNLIIGGAITLLGIYILASTISEIRNDQLNNSITKKNIIDNIKTKASDELKRKIGDKVPSEFIKDIRPNLLKEVKSEVEYNIKIMDEIKTNFTYRDFNKEDLIKLFPTFSLVLFIELFAYFFLRLYREGLSEMKYYQNELTNIESKLIAVEIALIKEDNESLKLTLDILSQTERNFILKKGETTAGLEHSKSELKYIQNILRIIPNLNKKEGN